MSKELLREAIKRLAYVMERYADGCWVEDRKTCPDAIEVGCEHVRGAGAKLACCECCQDDYIYRLINEILGGTDNV